MCNQRQLYRFSYDAANRLTAAAHRTWSGSAWTDPARYNESNITYDLNGNLKTYNRQGLISGTSTFGTIDNLTYTYSANIPDRLTAMTDAGNITKGFKYKNSIIGDHYLYDANGNMIQDKHKDLWFSYNHLNLPNSINNSADSYITLTYTADGEKLTKAAGGVTKNYVAGIEYAGANLEAIYHAEGRCTPNGSNFYYEYTLKDHLGNARVGWRAITNGTAIQVLQENHYYPFGMEQEGNWAPQVSTENQYQYNGKELNEDLGVNWYDYGARWYDAAVGRWWSVDPLGQQYKEVSPYLYVLNNPIRAIDPDGKRVYFVGGANNDQDGWNYMIRWSAAFTSVNIPFYRVNASEGKLNDVYFTARYRNSATDEYDIVMNGVTQHVEHPVSNDLINDTVDGYKDNLINDPLAEGEQFNLAGYSYGSVLQAQAAIQLANQGYTIDNLILIGSPISDKSKLWQQLNNNKNIKNIIRYDIEGDLLSNPQDVSDFLKGGAQNSSDDGPHFDLARPTVEADRLIQVVVEWLKKQGVEK